MPWGCVPREDLLRLRRRQLSCGVAAGPVRLCAPPQEQSEREHLDPLGCVLKNVVGWHVQCFLSIHSTRSHVSVIVDPDPCHFRPLVVALLFHVSVFVLVRGSLQFRRASHVSNCL